METRRRIHPVYWLVAFLLVLPVLVWFSGFFYWQIQINRVVADLNLGPRQYVTELFYANPDLLRIGSRGLPRLLREFQDAVEHGDEDRAFTFSCGIDDLFGGAGEVSDDAAAESGSYERTRPRLSMEQLRALCQDYQENWPEYRQHYAPWWMWWRGHEQRRGYLRGAIFELPTSP